jgi:ketosteroid isomerase-like protein
MMQHPWRLDRSASETRQVETKSSTAHVLRAGLETPGTRKQTLKMPATENSHEALIRSYLTALAAGAVGEQLAGFFEAEAEQIGLPNLLNPQGGRSDLATLLRRAEQGQKLLREQTHAVRSLVEQGPRLAVEAEWSAVLAVALGTLPAGHRMKAHFAMFFEIRNGRILSQRNYDCFEPWP